MNWLSPSILAADFNRLGEQIQCVRDCGAQALHFDVMDGLFVPSISFGMPVLASIRKETDMFLDVHLMIREPSQFLSQKQLHRGESYQQIMGLLSKEV